MVDDFTTLQQPSLTRLSASALHAAAASGVCALGWAPRFTACCISLLVQFDRSLLGILVWQIQVAFSRRGAALRRCWGACVQGVVSGMSPCRGCWVDVSVGVVVTEMRMGTYVEGL